MRKRGLRSLAAGGLLLTLVLPGRAWTLEEALEIGLEKGRVPRRLRSELAAARHAFGRTGADFRPRFEAIFADEGARTLKVTERLTDEARISATASDPADDRRPQTYEFDLFLPVFRTQSLLLKTAEYNWHATRLKNSQDLQDYLLAVTRDFYAVRRAQSVVAIRKQAVERWDANLESARFRADIGVKSKLDFWNTKVNQANAVVDLIRAEQAKRAAMDQLGNRLGVPFEEVQEAEETLVFEEFVPPEELAWTRADLEAVRYQVRLARASLDAARRAARPDLAFNLGVDKTEGTPDEGTATLTYRWQFGRRREDHDLRFNREALTQAEILLEQTEVDIVAEQRGALRDLEALGRSIAVARESLDLARLSYEASRIQFEGGRITQIEFQNAQDKLTEADRAYESSVIDYKIARFRWRRAYGERLDP